MKVVHITSYLDGGTVVIICDNKKKYYIDGRLGSKTKGEVFSSYPDAGTIVPQSEVWDLVIATKEYDNKFYRNHVLDLLATA